MEKLKLCPFCGRKSYIKAETTRGYYSRTDTAFASRGCRVCGYFLIKRATTQQIIDFVGKDEVWQKTTFPHLSKKARHLICKELRKQVTEAWNGRFKNG